MKSIFIKLTLIFLLSAIIPVIVSHGISIYKIAESSKETVMSGNLEVAKAAARDVENYFQSGFDILRNVVSELEQLPLDIEEKDHLLKVSYANHPIFQYLILTDLSGNVLATSQLTRKDKIEIKNYLPAILRGEFMISDVYIAKDPPPVRPAISLCFPVMNRGQVSHVLVAELNLVYAWHLVHQLKIGKNGEVFLVDAKGNIVASSNMSVLFELKPYPQFQSIASSAMLEQKNIFQKIGDSPDYLLSLVPIKLPFTGIFIVRELTSEAFEIADRISLQMYIVTVVVIALMILAGYVGVRKLILSPVRTLTAGLEQIAAGHWEHRININTGDEFSNMGAHYNDMADKLMMQADRIRKQERLSLIGKIAGGLIHDLKHPITNIRNWTRLMPAKVNESGFVEKFSSVVDVEFKNVDQFFVNLKDLTSEMPFNPKSFKLDTLVSEVKKRFEFDTREKNIQLVTLHDQDFDIIADYFLMLRVLSNLVNNAIQAMGNPGVIEITVAQNSMRTTFTVSDQGPGIAQERLQTLFDDFTTTKRRGLGLGLAISKKIIEMHGGEISVDSVVGKGTVFVFWIPKDLH